MYRHVYAYTQYIHLFRDEDVNSVSSFKLVSERIGGFI